MSNLEDATLGNVRLEKRIGAGETGEVFRAHTTTTREMRAVKVLYDDLSSLIQKPEFEQQMGQIVSQPHPNIVQVFQYGYSSEFGRFFIEMEWLPEHYTLRDVLENKIPFENDLNRLSHLLKLMEQVALALDFLHTKTPSLVHGNLKPSNLLLFSRGNNKAVPSDVKISDIALRPTDVGALLKKPGNMGLDTLLYTNPEWLQGYPQTAQSDIYMLGIILYEIVSGQPPFQIQKNPDWSTCFDEAFGQHCTPNDQDIEASLSSLSSIPGSPEFANRLRACITRCLKQQPDQRFESARALADALDTLPKIAQLEPPTIKAGGQVLSSIAQPEPPAIKDGVRIGNCYLDKLLGKGELGQVFRANNLNFIEREERAVKVFYPAFTWYDQKRDSFYADQLRLAATLEHQHIIEVHDSGKSHGHHYIEMDLIPQTLSTFLNPTSSDQGGKTNYGASYGEHVLHLTGLIDIVRQAADALHYAHTRRSPVLHRNIKPSNLLILAPGDMIEPDMPGQQKKRSHKVKVSDFGLNRSFREVKDNPNTIKQEETLIYASPEWFKGDIHDDFMCEQSDIYSLGIILYVIITGTLPFNKGKHSNQEFIKQAEDYHLHQEPTFSTLSSRRNQLPELQDIVVRCLKKNPKDRYSSAVELADELRNLIQVHKVELPEGARRPIIWVTSDLNRQKIEPVELTGAGITVKYWGSKSKILVGNETTQSTCLYLYDPRIPLEQSDQALQIDWKGKKEVEITILDNAHGREHTIKGEPLKGREKEKSFPWKGEKLTLDDSYVLHLKLPESPQVASAANLAATGSNIPVDLPEPILIVSPKQLTLTPGVPKTFELIFYNTQNYIRHPRIEITTELDSLDKNQDARIHAAGRGQNPLEIELHVQQINADMEQSQTIQKKPSADSSNDRSNLLRNQIQVGKQGRASAEVRVTVHKAQNNRAGNYNAIVQARQVNSVIYPNQTQTWKVEPFYESTLSVEQIPLRGWRLLWFRWWNMQKVTISNYGNTQSTYRLTCKTSDQDQDQDALTFDFYEPPPEIKSESMLWNRISTSVKKFAHSLTAQPISRNSVQSEVDVLIPWAESTERSLRVSSKELILFGSKRQYTVTVESRNTELADDSHEEQRVFYQTPIFPNIFWRFLLVMFTIFLFIIFARLWYVHAFAYPPTEHALLAGYLGPIFPSITPTYTSTPTPTITPTPTNTGTPTIIPTPTATGAPAPSDTPPPLPTEPPPPPPPPPSPPPPPTETGTPTDTAVPTPTPQFDLSCEPGTYIDVIGTGPPQESVLIYFDELESIRPDGLGGNAVGGGVIGNDGQFRVRVQPLPDTPGVEYVLTARIRDTAQIVPIQGVFLQDGSFQPVLSRPELSDRAICRVPLSE
jgi:serine/threonine protein kinase